MEPKNYEKYANQVDAFNGMFETSVKKCADDLTQSLLDRRYSEFGREELKKKKFAEIDAICDNMNNATREAVKRFIADFSINLPDDEQNHSIDIENALKVIDMLGFAMDVRNLQNILQPLKGSYRAMKTVLDVMRVKNETGASGLNPAENHYSNDVISMLDEYTGINSRVTDFFSIMDKINEIIDNPFGYRYEVKQYSNTTIVEIVEIIPYSFLSCPDWMREAGEMYATLENEFASLFTGHVPTNREMIESSFPDGHLNRA